jgi:O-glycosyl hydrolase
MKSNRSRLLAPLIALAAAAWPTSSSADVAIQVNDAVRHQTFQGFGATTLSLMFGPNDNVPPALRTQAIDAIYNQVRLNMGNLEIGPFESPSTMLYSPANDDADPNTFNPAGFNWQQSDNMMNGVVSLARPFGFTDFWIGPAQSDAFEFAWAVGLRTTNYDRYLDEAAEHIAAIAIHWRDAYGITPRYMQLWNEPVGGNWELRGATVANMTDIVIRAGARLRREGFATMTFVIPADETEQLSLDEAATILSNPMARPYVGAIAYHPYPYGSTYSSVPNILSTSGAGMPSATAVAVRNRLRDLGAMYGIPVMMVEVSHSNLPWGDFDNMRGRAIHIHDEMVYADAAAFFGMNAMWDSVTHREHYAGRTDPGLFSEVDTIVLIDDEAGQIYMSEMGRAIGQYARWIRPGSVRVDATTDDSLVQVTAFRDDRSARLSLVVINNATASRVVHVNLSGVTLTSANITGEQSTAAAYWQPITPFAPASTGFTVTVPARSVTSYAGTIAGATPSDAGVVDSGSPDVVVPTDVLTPPDAGCAGTMCGGVCTDTQTDALNCGGCGNVVCHTEICVGGARACPSGRTACGTPFSCLGCKDLSEDPMNCGACGNACASGQFCSAGTCVASCPAGTTTCGASCVTDTQTDVANCGACGVACNPGNVCVAGSCVRMSSGAPDAGTSDAAVEDVASADASEKDTGSVSRDSGAADAALDGSTTRADAAADARTPGTTNPGCGCRVPDTGRTRDRPVTLLAACAAVVIARRRRRLARHTVG